MKTGNRAGFITHKGKQVLVLDFTNCTAEEVTLLAEEAERIITGQPHDSVLVLADFEGSQFGRDAVTRIKEVTTQDRPFVKRAAWVHTGSLPKVLYGMNAKSRGGMSFRTESFQCLGIGNCFRGKKLEDVETAELSGRRRI